MNSKTMVALIAIVIGGLAALPTASATNPTLPHTTLQTAAIGKGSRLHPGVLLMAPVRYHGKLIKHYQWERCNRSGHSCARITHATKRSYRLTLKDVGHTFRVLMVVDNTVVQSGPTAVVGPPLPVNTVLPAITDPSPAVAGQITPGDTLSGTLGSWTGALSYSWVWQQCDSNGATCVAILGAAGGPTTMATTIPTYVVLTGDIGHTLRLVVTAFNH